jgi:hypothetical protein
MSIAVQTGQRFHFVERDRCEAADDRQKETTASLGIRTTLGAPHTASYTYNFLALSKARKDKKISIRFD